MKTLSGCLLLLAATTAAVAAQDRRYASTPVTLTATIEAIDTATRVVTLRGPNGNSIDVKAPDQMQGFDTLKVGDVVSATYFEAVAVRIRKPGDPAPSSEAMTTVMRKDRTPGSETRREQTLSVAIEAVDKDAKSIRVKGPEGRTMTLAVEDATQLENLKAGDTVDITYVESLMVKVARQGK